MPNCIVEHIKHMYNNKQTTRFPYHSEAARRLLRVPIRIRSTTRHLNRQHQLNVRHRTLGLPCYLEPEFPHSFRSFPWLASPFSIPTAATVVLPPELLLSPLPLLLQPSDNINRATAAHVSYVPLRRCSRCGLLRPMAGRRPKRVGSPRQGSSMCNG